MQRADGESQYPSLDSSPPRVRSTAVAQDAKYADDDDAATDDLDGLAKTLPGSPKLKGVHWPGMALFDAAPEELKKKRNQKKDVSVLENLERNAAMVEPTETVSSAIGTVLKRRHMDDLENDSPVEGEIIILPSPKKRKEKAPRARRQTRQQGAKRPGRPGRLSRTSKTYSDTPSKIRATSTDILSDIASQLPPTENESGESKIIVRGFGRKRSKKNMFSIYEDSSPAFGVDGASESAPSAYVDTGLARPQLVPGPPSFPRQHVGAYDPFRATEDFLPSPQLSFADLGQGKENDLNFFFDGVGTMHNPMTANPLFFGDRDARYGPFGEHKSENRLNPAVHTRNYNRFDGDNASVPIRNPLMLSMSQLNKTEADEKPYIPGVFQRQPLFAPR